MTFNPAIFDILNELSQNNNRDWFMAHKPQIDEQRHIFEGFVDKVIEELYKFDKSIGMQTAKSCMYRMYRDTRFSKDKTPYKTHIAAFIACGGQKNHGMPGYYLHLENNGSCLGGGIYMPLPDNLKKIRKEIYYNIDEFKNIIQNKEYAKYYNGFFDGEKLKKAPKDFPADFPDIDLLKYKNYATINNLENKTVLGKDIFEQVMNAFKATVPLNQFFCRAIIE